MSFETGTPSNMNDLMTKLSTFAVANSWVQDQYTAESGATDGKLSLHHTNVFVHFAWNSSESPHIGMYQSLGFISAGTNIWQHTDDSGNGKDEAPNVGSGWNSQVDRNRFIKGIGSGPYTSYAFHEGNATEEYIHIVLEYSPGIFRHFGFGEIEKTWDWTGGEYCYAHTQAESNPANQPAILCSNGGTSTSDAERHPTLHIESAPGEPGTSKWGVFANFSTLSSSFNDRAGNNQIKVVGGCPGGPIGQVFNSLPSNSGDGFLPLTPNAIWYIDITPSPDNIYLLGFQPDVRSLNMKSLSPKAEITIGSDTWIVYPHARKQNTGSTDESRNLGIAYLKNV